LPLVVPAGTLPQAVPPGPINRFNKDLDLPEIDHYGDEVLRYVRGGLAPGPVVQFAVLRPGQPVQVMIIRVQDVSRGDWRAGSRSFGTLPWAAYLAMRTRALDTLFQTPPEPGKPSETGRIIGVCGDVGDEISFNSTEANVALTKGGCFGAVSRLGEEMIHSAETALAPTAP
jgi:hypothetical protein